jgi:hypothetical protein
MPLLTQAQDQNEASSYGLFTSNFNSVNCQRTEEQQPAPILDLDRN